MNRWSMIALALLLSGCAGTSKVMVGSARPPLHHSEVMETTQQVKGQFISLLEGIIGRL